MTDKEINDFLVNRVSRAVDDYEWEGDFLQADLHREELRHIDALKAEGDLYVPRF